MKDSFFSLGKEGKTEPGRPSEEISEKDEEYYIVLIRIEEKMAERNQNLLLPA